MRMVGRYNIVIHVPGLVMQSKTSNYADDNNNDCSIFSFFIQLFLLYIMDKSIFPLGIKRHSISKSSIIIEKLIKRYIITKVFAYANGFCLWECYFTALLFFLHFIMTFINLILCSLHNIIMQDNLVALLTVSCSFSMRSHSRYLPIFVVPI